MEQVFLAFTAVEAHLVKGLLESEGISAEVRGEGMAPILGDVPILENLPSVWVADREVSRAQQIVRDFKRERVATGDAWRCECGEAMGAQFAACWRCGTDRPSAKTGGHTPTVD